MVELIRSKFAKLKTEVDSHMIGIVRTAERQLGRLGEKRDALFANFSQVAGTVMGGGALSGLGSSTAAERQAVAVLQAQLEAAQASAGAIDVPSAPTAPRAPTGKMTPEQRQSYEADLGEFASAQRAYDAAVARRAAADQMVDEIAARLATATRATETLTASDLTANLQAKVTEAGTFAANLLKLQGMKLNKDALAQLAQAGADQAGGIAAALVDGGAPIIAQMNGLQTQLTTAATTTAKVGSLAMYEAGLQTAKGWQQGFASQEKAIEAQMLKIARAMQKAIKKALGIRSPSTVFEGIGVNTALGFVNGVESMQGRAQAATGALAGSPGTIAGQARAGAGGPTTIQLMSPNGQVLIQWLLRAQRDNGGSIPDLLTGTA
jgi:hypothetical protein